jgi:citrate lyase subunit beta/citryl-CoA lyase
LGHAKQVIKAYEEAIAKGKGITTLDGQLIERLHVEMARDLISRADVISSFENLD